MLKISNLERAIISQIFGVKKPKIDSTLSTLSERPLSKLSEINVIGPTELKLWPSNMLYLTLNPTCACTVHMWLWELTFSFFSSSSSSLSCLSDMSTDMDSLLRRYTVSSSRCLSDLSAESWSRRDASRDWSSSISLSLCRLLSVSDCSLLRLSFCTTLSWMKKWELRE